MSSYVQQLTFQIDPARLAEFEAMMAVEAPLTRSFDGCELFEIYAVSDVPGAVIFLEHWRSEKHSQAYGQWRTDRGDMDRLGAFFTAPPKVTILRRMASA